MKKEMLILIVEGDDLPRFSIPDLLQLATGHQAIITTVHCGDDALSELVRRPYDLVLTNLLTNNVVGYEILAFVKTLKHPPRCVVVSTLNDAHSKLQTSHMGARFLPTESSEDRARLTQIIREQYDELLSSEPLSIEHDYVGIAGVPS